MSTKNETAAPSDASPNFAKGLVDLILEWEQKLKPMAAVLSEALRKPEVARFLEELPARLAKANTLLKELPENLRDALRDRGRSVHPELSLSDVIRIDSEYKKGGVDAAVAEVDRLHEELLASAQFREEAEKRWTHSKRASLFAQLLKAHDQGMYFLTIPAALSHAEGLAVEFMEHRGKINGPKLRQLLEQFLKDDELLGPSATEFSTWLLMRKFEHGMAIPPFNRHAILHGADTEYATKQNSIQIIVWIDYLLWLQFEKKTDPMSG
jgi:hypothetical protein